MLSFIIVLCSQGIGELLPLGTIIFVLLVNQFIGLIFVQLHGDYLDAREQVRSHKTHFTKVQRLLELRNSFQVENQSKVPSFACTAWAGGLKITMLIGL